MKRAVRRQTINHFIYTFMKDYDTEKAADRTMKSKYVPNNLKTQLVAAMSKCDATDHFQIERVARLGMFIDSSCNELVYYNTITTAVMRWTISLYVDSADIKRIFEMVMEDAGRICDEDIHFIMEKYRYLEESAGGTVGKESVEGGVLGFLKARKHSPDTSLIWYYGNSLWLKILRAALRNSMNIFNSNSFSSVFTGIIDMESEGNEESVNGEEGCCSKNVPDNSLDKETQDLYKEFRGYRTEWLKSVTRSNREKIENSVTADYDDDDTASSENDYDSRNSKKKIVRPVKTNESRSRLPRPPPNISTTAFDVPFNDYDDRDDEIILPVVKEYSSNDSDSSEAETVLRAPTYTNHKRCHQNRPGEELEIYNRNEAVVPETHADTFVISKITQEKKLHIMDKNLKNIIMEAKTSKELSAQTGDINMTGSITTVFTKRGERLMNLPLELSPVGLKPIGSRQKVASKSPFENGKRLSRFAGLEAPPALQALPPPQSSLQSDEDVSDRGNRQLSLFFADNFPKSTQNVL
jgi:hypothetical protein